MAEYIGQHHIYDSAGRIGHGGMAEVYEGWARNDPTVHVALKVPLPHLSREGGDLFLREAQAAQQVSGPYVVPVVDWGQSPDFIAFEFIDGPTLDTELHTWQREQRPRGDRELGPLFRQLVTAMKAINTQVIHRDLKPANIFVVDGHLKVSDFGISKYVGDLTRTRSFKGAGTAPYMAPETFKLERVDEKADQYSLGVVFFEMAAARWPFTGPRWEDFEKQHLFTRPPRASAINGDVSERLASLIARMLSKRADERFESWDAVDRELAAIQSGVPPEGGRSITNPLVARAAERIESVRSRELEAERQANELRRVRENREQLVDYWADEIFGNLELRVDELNQHLGGSAIGVQRLNRQRGTERSCWVRFLNAELHIRLEPLPLDAPDQLLAWGAMSLKTNKRGAVENLLLRAEPEPYGSWLEVNMNVSGLVSSWSGDDREGGQYDVFGNDRLVLAINWQGLLFQRKMRTTISHVNYDEELLNFDRTLDQLMEIFVEDAAAEKPPPMREPDVDWPFR